MCINYEMFEEICTIIKVNVADNALLWDYDVVVHELQYIVHNKIPLKMFTGVITQLIHVHDCTYTLLSLLVYYYNVN